MEKKTGSFFLNPKGMAVSGSIVVKRSLRLCEQVSSKKSRRLNQATIRETWNCLQTVSVFRAATKKLKAGVTL